MTPFREFIASIDQTSTAAPRDTVPHGPHQRPMDYCAKAQCRGHTWEKAFDRKANYGFRLFSDGFLQSN